MSGQVQQAREKRQGGGIKGRPVGAGPTLSVAEARAKVSPARLAAFEILLRVAHGKGHSDELLHSELTDGLTPEDRNLATALVMGVLRWQIGLDARVKGLLQRPEQRLAEPVAMALRLGVFQLLHMDRIPAHAALSESVELCRAAGEPHATGMVNAVLRKVASAQPGLSTTATLSTQSTSSTTPTSSASPTSQRRDVGHPVYGLVDGLGGEPVAAFAERLGHPLWLVERWVAAYGREAALKICEADQQEHGAGGMFAAGDGEGAALPVMDDGSRLVAEIAAAAMPGGLDRTARVWDCCAAPGGKTLLLALRLAEAEVLATDVSAKRLAQMEARLRRHGYAERVRCAVADAADGVLESGKSVRGDFDLILCDVPCSGTGTLAGNPEIRHFLRPEELARQAERQGRILRGALKRLTAGGRSVYSTCSLEREECEAVVAAVEADGGVRRVAVEGLMGGLDGVLAEGVDWRTMVREGALRTLPGVHGCDGFFAVVLERA